MTVARSLSSLLALVSLSWLLLAPAPLRAEAPACAEARPLELVSDCFLDLRGNLASA